MNFYYYFSVNHEHQVIEQVIEQPIFTIISPSQEYIVDQNVETVQEIHYLQEPLVENVVTEGIPAVIHYIQLDPAGHELVAETSDTFQKIM